jgi:hypothetical protein
MYPPLAMFGELQNRPFTLTAVASAVSVSMAPSLAASVIAYPVPSATVQKITYFHGPLGRFALAGGRMSTGQS